VVSSLGTYRSLALLLTVSLSVYFEALLLVCLLFFYNLDRRTKLLEILVVVLNTWQKHLHKKTVKGINFIKVSLQLVSFIYFNSVAHMNFK